MIAERSQKGTSMIRIAMLAVALAFGNAVSQVAHAAEERWGVIHMPKLLELWKSNDDTKLGIAYGYVVATFDSLTTEDNVCLPAGLNFNDVVKRVMQEAETSFKSVAVRIGNEEVPAFIFVKAGFTRAYRCTSGPTKR